MAGCSGERGQVSEPSVPQGSHAQKDLSRHPTWACSFLLVLQPWLQGPSKKALDPIPWDPDLAPLQLGSPWQGHHPAWPCPSIAAVMPRESPAQSMLPASGNNRPGYLLPRVQF
jgi:hypothetical protein